MAILVGTASWTDKSLIDSGWYPSGVSSAEERLQHYASQFPLVEVDSTYYFLPPRANSERWRDRTPPDFTFNIKAYSLLTQHPTRSESIPDDLSVPAGKDRVYLRHLHPKTVDAIWSRFVDALRPLQRDGKLGALLFQFPPWFTLKGANKDYVIECAERARHARICVEFRHNSWMSEANREETIEFLSGYDIAYVAVDMPQGTKSSVPPVAVATSGELAVIRLHGRAKAGGRGVGPATAAYRYRKEELRRWLDTARALEEQAGTVHVIFRNAYRDYAVRNAAQAQALLEEASAGSRR